MNENSIFFAVDKIEDKYIEEAAESVMEENSVQPQFITPTQKKTKKPIFAILGIAACFALFFAIGIAVSRNSGIEITQTLPPIDTAEIQTTTITTTPADTSISNTTTSQADTKTPIDTTAEDGVPIKSKAAFTETEKAEILRAYKHLKTYFDEYLSADYPKAGQYITSIDDVRYADDLYITRYSDTPEFKPEKEIEFWVTCSDNEILSSSYNNEWYRVSIFNNQWTTYAEYKLNRKTPIDAVANDGVPIKSKDGFTEKEKADILEAYEALKIYIDNLNINYPNGSQYIVSVDDVRHAGGNFHDPRPGATDYRPSNAYEFWVTCDYKPLSSSYKNEWFLVSKSNDGWTA